MVALTDVSFTLKNGEPNAFFGLSDSGKSTIIKPFTRLYSPLNGSIIYISTNSHEIHKDKIRSKMESQPGPAVIFRNHTL